MVVFAEYAEALPWVVHNDFFTALNRLRKLFVYYSSGASCCGLNFQTFAFGNGPIREGCAL